MTNKLIPFYPLAMLISMTLKCGGFSIKKLPLYFLFILRYILLEPFRLLEILLYHKKIEKQQLDQGPIFILGHWRSGTSHLQNMLNKDPNSTTTSLYGLLLADNSMLTEFWLKPILNFSLKILNVNYTLQRTQMDLNIVGELDSGLCSSSSFYGYTWAHIFPRRFREIMDHLVFDIEPDVSQYWLNDLDFQIKKLSYRNKNRQVIVKSPGDTARVRLLLQKYPKAKFIYIDRDPYEVFRSTQYLWSVIQKQNSFQIISKDDIDQAIIETYKKLILAYRDQKDLVPTNQLIEISMTDLQRSPLECLKLVYGRLELGPLPINELKEYLDNIETYTPIEHSLSSEQKELLKREWDFAFEDSPRDSL